MRESSNAILKLGPSYKKVLVFFCLQFLIQYL